MSTIGTEDLYAQHDSGVGDGIGSGLTREQKPTKQALGFGGLVDDRMFGAERTKARAAARARPEKWHVSKDDRMDAQQAAATIVKIEEAFGITKLQPEELEAFWEAVFFYHTLNSGSVAQPGRSNITFAGTTVPFAQVLMVLGNDNRRFFRAMANEVYEVNKKVLANAGSRDIEDREKAEWLKQVATERGLARYPALAHDSADACWGLDAAQQAAIANSKMAVTGRTNNFVDTYSGNARIRSEGGTINDNPAVARGRDA